MMYGWIGISLSIALLLLGLLRGIGDDVSLAHGQIQDSTSSSLLGRSRSLLEQDVPLLTTKAAGNLDVILDPIFAAYHRKIPEFAAWAFQWRTSYSLLRRGVITAVTIPFTDPPRLQHFGEAWDDLITEKFDELVLRPAGGESALREARNRWELEVNADLKNTVTDAVLMTALIRGQDLTLWTWQPIAAEDVTHKNAFSLADAIGAVTNPIKMHAVRPLLTRLIIRPPVAAAVTVTGEVISGYGDFGFLGNATGFVATIAGFMSIDYLISRIDAAVSQKDLEIELHQALDTEHERLRGKWLATMQLRINTQIIDTKEALNKTL